MWRVSVFKDFVAKLLVILIGLQAPVLMPGQETSTPPLSACSIRSGVRDATILRDSFHDPIAGHGRRAC